MGVTSLGRHIRPACHQASRGSIKLWQECRFNSCVRVLYSYGSREFLWPYMGIVTSHKSHGWNARFWLVETNFAALWLVRTYRGHYHYFFSAASKKSSMKRRCQHQTFGSITKVKPIQPTFLLGRFFITGKPFPAFFSFWYCRFDLFQLKKVPL